jgi:hypothetical protein
MHGSVVRSNVNAEILDGLFISRFNIKIVHATMVEITVTRLREIIALIVTNRDVYGTTDSN